MKTLGDQTTPELVNLQPLAQLQPGGAIPVVPADCADDAPC
jgi:hypothetical protein